METGTPWELTREEFERQLVSTGRREWYGPGPYGLLVAHEEEIRAALRHGQLVPERVLQNYPHLLEQAMKAKLKLKPATKTAPTRSTPKKQLTAKPGVPSLKGDDLHAYGQRWQKGENIAVLAREIGTISWNRLHSELTKLGYHKGN